MTTLASVMDDAALRCSLRKPADWIGDTGTTTAEMKLFLRETVSELLDRCEWPAPLGVDTNIVGTGASTYALPSDFLRLMRDEWVVYEQMRTRRAAMPVHSNAAWTHLQQTNAGGGDRYYRITGDEDAGFSISFHRALETGAQVTVAYIGKNWLRKEADNSLIDAWAAATDKLLLPAVLVRLGVTWRFKQKKGLPHSDILAEYETRLSRTINDYRGYRSINMGDARQGDWRPPVPDHIPG